MKDDGFIRVIDSPHVIEIISERFDNALELMGRSSLAYGGAIRDILADLPIGGDLDIVVNNYAYQEVVAQFQASAKWTRVNAKGVAQVPVLKPTNTKKGPGEMSYKPTFSSTSRLATRNPYETSVPMVETVSFETFDQARVQLVRARTNKEKDHTDPLFMPLDLARGADIRCCSLAVNGIGKIFELVDGAFIDCKDRVLRTNKIKDPDRFNNLEGRIEKLKARGWKSKINIVRVREILKKAREKQKKEVVEITHSPENPWQGLGFVVEANTVKGGYNLDVDRSLSKTIRRDLRQLIFEFCKKNKVADINEVIPKHPAFYSYHAKSLGSIRALAEHIIFIKKKTSFSEILRGGPVKSSKSYAEYKKRYLDDAPEVAQSKMVQPAEPPEPVNAEYTTPEYGVYVTSDEYLSAPPDLAEFGSEASEIYIDEMPGGVTELNSTIEINSDGVVKAQSKSSKPSRPMQYDRGAEKWVDVNPDTPISNVKKMHWTGKKATDSSPSKRRRRG